MPPVTTFAILVRLALAARKLAVDPDPLNRASALADLAGDTGKLIRVIRKAGLDPLAREMTDRAIKADAAFAHAGPNKDDARLIFDQVAPQTLSDPALLAGSELDPDATLEAMVTAIRARPTARDFTQTQLAEPYFRAIAGPMLRRMLADKDQIDDLSPALWRRTLAAHGIQIGMLEEIHHGQARIESEVGELRDDVRALLDRTDTAPAREAGVSETALIRLASRIADDVPDAQTALLELARAVEIAERIQREGHTPSNHGDFVDEVLSRVADLAAEGEYDRAGDEIDEALAREEAEHQARKLRLLDTGIDTALLSRETARAADLLIHRAEVEAGGPVPVKALQLLQLVWFERGNRMALNLDLEVSVDLARLVLARAADSESRRTSESNLGNALLVIGERIADTRLLEEAISTFRAALEILVGEVDQTLCAATQMNLANALAKIGELKSDTEHLNEAVEAYNAALSIFSPELTPYEWSTAKVNLATALRVLGDLEVNTERLKASVEAYREVLMAPVSIPRNEVSVQRGLGAALASIGELERSPAQLIEAKEALCSALEALSPERTRFEWASTKVDLGSVLVSLGWLERSTTRLEQAIIASREVLQVFNREHFLPQWSSAISNVGQARAAIAELTGNIALAYQALDQLCRAEAAARGGGDTMLTNFFDRHIIDVRDLIRRLGGGGV